MSRQNTFTDKQKVEGGNLRFKEQLSEIKISDK